MKKLFFKYRFFIILLIINILIVIFFPGAGEKCFLSFGSNLLNFIFVLTPVFIILGLLDVWINKETMQKIVGKESGLKGMLSSFLLGITTAVPFYALLPVAGMLLKKGTKILNVLLFICSSTTMRIPLLLFEASSLGLKYTVIRLAVNLAGVPIIALTINGLLTKEDEQKIYANANEL